MQLDSIALEKLRQTIHARIEEQTPLPGNKCHSCGGEIVKKVSGIYGNQPTYSSPVCNDCGRVYYYASNVLHVVTKEFLELLAEPIRTPKSSITQ